MFSNIDPQLRMELYNILATKRRKLQDVFVYSNARMHTTQPHKRFHPYTDAFNAVHTHIKPPQLQRLFLDGMERYYEGMPDPNNKKQQKTAEFMTMLKDPIPNMATLTSWAFYNQVRADIRTTANGLLHEFTNAPTYNAALAISRKISKHNSSLLRLISDDPEFASLYIHSWFKDHAKHALHHLVAKLQQHDPAEYYRLAVSIHPPNAKPKTDYDAKLEIMNGRIVLELPDDWRAEFPTPPTTTNAGFDAAAAKWIKAIYDNPHPRYGKRLTTRLLYAEGKNDTPPQTELYAAMYNYIKARQVLSKDA